MLLAAMIAACSTLLGIDSNAGDSPSADVDGGAEANVGCAFDDPTATFDGVCTFAP
jgi:hypothetical protein